MPTIAYLGPEQTNAHAAAQARFGSRCRYVHAPTIDDVLDLVEREDGTILAATDFGGTVEQLSPDGTSLGALIYPPQVSRPHGLLILR